MPVRAAPQAGPGHRHRPARPDRHPLGQGPGAAARRASPSDEWWVDVTLPMLELARRRVRALVRFVDKTKRAIVYSDFADELGEGTIVELPGVTPGHQLGAVPRQGPRLPPRPRGPPRPAAAAPQPPAHPRGPHRPGGDAARVRRRHRGRHRQAREEAHGLGLFVRSLVGLDREAATEAFDRYLTDTTFTANQLRFVNLIVEHLTANGAMEVARLYESPFTDNAPHGPGHASSPRTRSTTSSPSSTRSATGPCPTSPSPDRRRPGAGQRVPLLSCQGAVRAARATGAASGRVVRLRPAHGASPAAPWAHAPFRPGSGRRSPWPAPW